MARESLQGRWNELAVIMLVYVLVSVLFGNVISWTGTITHVGWLSGLGAGVNLCVALLVALPFGFAIMNLCLLITRNETTDETLMQQTFNDFKANWRTYVCSGTLVTIIICVVGALTLGIGLVIFGLAYALVPFVIHDNPDIDYREALRTSRMMMRGHKMDLFLLYLSFIGWLLLCVLTLGVAALWVESYIYTSLAHFYEDIKAEDDMLKAGEYTPA